MKNIIAPFFMRIVLLASLMPALAIADTGQNGPQDSEYLEGLYLELLQAGPDDWMAIEEEIASIWSRSGSDAMDFLLERGHSAIMDQDYAKAIEHLSALIDHAPDFAEAYNSRATAFYLMGEYGLSLADIRSALAINPRHFGALAGLGMIHEELGNYEAALAVFLELQAIHPHLENINDAIIRLSKEVEGVEL